MREIEHRADICRWLLVIGVWIACLGVSFAQEAAQEVAYGISFVDERMLIPDSDQFADGSYISSGVGLKFGVDKRLTYLAGEYEDAVEAFEESVKTYRYKAEIWVYLARAYFYSESPELAKQTLERAAQTMPDLDARLWQPLIVSLLDEIRQRANQQQIQLDFYSPDQQGVLSLFRLYVFLEDPEGAMGVIRAARARGVGMRERSTMVAGMSQGSIIQQAENWDALAESLTRELAQMGVEMPASETPQPEAPPRELIDAAAAKAVERERILQLRVDFYKAGPSEFVELFDGYMGRDDLVRARLVAKRAGEEVVRLKMAASVAATVQDEDEIQQKIQKMATVHTAFESQLAAVEPEPEAEAQP